MADQVLHSGVRSITDLMVLPGLINLDFADVRTVMTEMGKAMMGTGEATGEARAMLAAQNAIQNPLLDEVSLKGAKAVLVNVTGGPDMTLLEVDEACNAISAEVDPDANTIFGAAFDESLTGKIRVSVVATGMDGMAISAIEPKPVRITAPPVVRTAEPAIQMETPAPVAATPIVEPVAVQPDLIPQPMVARVAPEPQPAPVEAAPIMKLIDPLVADLDDDFDAPLTADPVAADEPRIVTNAQDDEAGEAADDDDGALFIPSRREQPQKAGWLSLFGGRRYEPAAEDVPVPQFRNKNAAGGVRSTSSAQPVHEADADQDDLEIPSFLRRLAN